MVFSFELFVNLISPHATKVARPTNLRCRLNRYCFSCSSQSGEKGLGLLSSDGRATNNRATRRARCDLFQLRVRPQRRSGSWASQVPRSFHTPFSFHLRLAKCGPLPCRKHLGG